MISTSTKDARDAGCDPTPNKQTFNETDLFLTFAPRYISDAIVLAKFDAESDYRLVRAIFNNIPRRIDNPRRAPR